MWFVGSALVLATLICPIAKSAEIESVYPTGAVKAVQQVTARFNAEMVPLGDPKAHGNPLTLACKDTSGEEANPTFTTRWADSRNWSLDFDEPLPSGVRCTLKVTNGFKDLEGKPLTGAPEYSFTTGGPAIVEIAPKYGDIEPGQFIVALVDGEPDPNSIKQHAYFEVQGLKEKVKVEIFDGPERIEILGAAIKDNWQWNEYRPYLEKLGDPISQKALKNFMIFKAGRSFPEKSKVVLHWPEKILSKSGLPVTEPQTFQFQVIQPFAAKFTCPRSEPTRPCLPISDMRLEFTRRLPLEQLQKVRLKGPNGREWLPLELLDGDKNRNFSVMIDGKLGVGAKIISNFEDKQVDSLTFPAPFPADSKFSIEMPGPIVDELGRELTNSKKFPLEVSTDKSSPLIKFPGVFGILEADAEPILPVSVRNVEKLLGGRKLTFAGKSLSVQKTWRDVISAMEEIQRMEWDYDRRSSSYIGESSGEPLSLPNPTSEKELEVIGIPMEKPGFYVVEFASPKLGEVLLGEKSTMYVRTSVLVTKMAVHLKFGRESSIAWVTEMGSAKPVNDAEVKLVCSEGDDLASAKTDKSGIARFEAIEKPSNCRLYAFASKGEDVSFVSEDWTKGIESYRYDTPMEYLNESWGPAIQHTVVDRMIAQPGDKIQMRHVVREHFKGGFRAMSTEHLPKRVLIVHSGSQKTYEIPFNYSKDLGGAINDFTIPKGATLGQYEIYLSNRERSKDEDGEFDWSARSTGNFLVSEYRLPLMRSTLKIKGEPLVRPKKVDVDIAVGFLSGGPAKNQKAVLRSIVSDGYFTPEAPGGIQFSYFARPIKEGIVAQEQEEAVDRDSSQDIVLDAKGGYLASIGDIPVAKGVQQLTVELEYSDPNGEIKTSSATAPIFPAQYIIGLRTEGWYAAPGKASVSGIITDVHGKPKSGRKYVIEAFKMRYITHRKRIVGGFYSYDSKTEITRVGPVCEGKSEDTGMFDCKAENLPPGSYLLQAKTTDDEGNDTFARTDVEIFGEGASWWWTPSDSDRMDLVPEKNRYEPNDEAEIVLRMPFEKATVLVTTEREGVLDAFVTEVERDDPVIEVPIRGDYAPNVFVSALAIRGRVGEPKPTGLLDLAKPAMKLGIIELKVGWKAHELEVEVSPNKKRFKTREKVEVEFEVEKAVGGDLPKNATLIVAVVDESLMLLKENSSWNILQAMMQPRSLAVATASAQNQIIGKRHFGQKAKPVGGGGGLEASDQRELFDPIIYWNPELKLDDDGEAKISFNLNDSITGFRIVAVATAGDQFFGTGRADIVATKDLILYSGFAPVVRTDDVITNVVTIRNTTSSDMRVAVTLANKSEAEIALPGLPEMTIGPSESKILPVPMVIPNTIKPLQFQIAARDTKSDATDALLVKQEVEPAVPLRVFQATMFQLEKQNSTPVERPETAIVGRGGIQVDVKPSLVSGLGGVKSYMADYPYTCSEQNLSRAIVAENKKAIQAFVDGLPALLDSDGLVKFFPISICGYDMLTRYVLNILKRSEVTIPGSTVERMLSGVVASVEGRISCRNWWQDLVRSKYRNESKILLIDSLSQYGRFKKEYLEPIEITPNLWANETVAAWFSLLEREAEAIPKRDEQLAQARNIMRSRVNYQSTLMNLQRQLDWEGSFELFATSDLEAMSFFGVSLNDKSWQSDVGKMARGIVARLKKGRWDATPANAWGIVLMREFSKKFEKEKITGQTEVELAGAKFDQAWESNPAGSATLLPWPEKGTKPVVVTQKGTGKPWVQLQSVAAIPLKEPLMLGYSVKRKISNVQGTEAKSWKVGDVVNVELEVEAKADQPWVVVRDPIPAGASHLGTGADGESAILNRDANANKNALDVKVWPMEFAERGQRAFTAYAAYLPRGKYRLSYRVRLNSAGKFQLPPSRVEAMYAPETFGEAPNATWTVNE